MIKKKNISFYSLFILAILATSCADKTISSTSSPLNITSSLIETSSQQNSTSSSSSTSQESIISSLPNISPELSSSSLKDVYLTIAFDTQGGSIIFSQDIKYNEKVIKPSDPIKIGYTFDYWYKANDLSFSKYNFDELVYENFTLIARWVTKKYTITFDKQDGIGGSDSVAATFNENMPAATAPTKENYSFLGYYDDKDYSVQYYNSNMESVRKWDKTSDSILFARWSIKTYIVTFDKQSGTEGTNSIIVVYNQEMPQATMPVNEGYKFLGYYDINDVQYYNENMESVRKWDKVSNSTLYAKWDKDDSYYTLGLSFSLSGDSYSVSVGNAKNATKIIIPKYYNDLLVTAIGNNGFDGCNNLTKIVIPDSIISIGNWAFWGCSDLNNINLPNSLKTIGAGVFIYCHSLESIFIPSSVTSMSTLIFSNCDNLVNLSVDSENTRFRSEGNCIINKSTDEVLFGCKGSVIPNNAKSIGSYAFDGCNGLTTLTIPSSVISIGNKAFADCDSLISLTVDAGNTKFRSEGNCIIDKSTDVLLFGCLGSIIPSSVTSIGREAFTNCNGLTSIIIPSNVLTIGIRAFYDCNNLTDVTIFDGVTSIDSEAFYGCGSLEDITIPDSVLTIGKSAFILCQGLKTIILSNNITKIETETFSYCGDLISIIIPNKVVSIGIRAFYNCNTMVSITIPDGLTTISDEAFLYCRKLKSIIIPSSVTSMGKWAFYYCDSLTIYVRGYKSAPNAWAYDWNNDGRPVVWNYTL